MTSIPALVERTAPGAPPVGGAGRRRDARRAGLLAGIALGLLTGLSAPRAQESLEALQRAGVEARQAGRFDEAVDALSRAAAIQPDDPDTQVQLGLALGVAGRHGPAREALERALRLSPDYHDARLGLARLSYWSGDLPGAERELAALRERAPDHPEAAGLAADVARAREAEAAAEAARTRQAAEAAEAARTRAAALSPAQPRQVPAPASGDVLRSTIVTGPGEDRPVARAARPAPPADPAAAALAHRRAGRFPQAEAAYAGILARYPKDAERWVDLGIVRAFQGPKRFREAREALERALALQPDYNDAILGLARVDLYESAFESCAARLDTVLAKVPDHPEALGLRARLRLAQGDAAGAQADFSGLAARNPRDAEVLTGLGDAQRALYRDVEARDSYARALEIEPDSVDIRKRLEAPVRTRWTLDVNAGTSRLTGGLAPWREGGVHLGYRVDEATSLTGGVEVNRRFGRIDNLFDLRLDRRWSETFSGYLRLGGTPAADYRPSAFVEAGGTIRLWRGPGGFLGATYATVDLGFAHYRSSGEARSASVGIEQNFFDDRLRLSAKGIGTLSTDDERLGGYIVRADVTLSEGFQVFAGYADAPDSSDGRSIPTQSVFGGAAWSPREDLTVRLSLAREARSRSYDRSTASVGVSVRY